MAILQFPTIKDLAHYTFELPLDGTVFRFKFKYNSREEAWYFNILDLNNVILRAGVKVVNEWSLLRLWPALTGRPLGSIITVNLGKVPAPPTLDQLGEDVVLTYNEGA